LKNEKIVKHCLAVSAIMEKLAKYFKEDEREWRIAGLLHDIDYEITKENPKKHGILAEEILRKEIPSISSKILRAIRRHAYGLNNEPAPETLMEKMLVAADQISGLIIATALVMPDKRLRSVKVKNVKNRFKEKAFARGVNREKILKMIDGIIELDKFIEISLKALQGISDKLGL